MTDGIETTVPQGSQDVESVVQTAQVTEATTPQTEPTQEETAKPEPRKLKVKHLHEEKEITEDEAIPLIQKGMDYDRVKTQAEQAMEDRNYLAKLSKIYGMDPDTFKKEMEATAEEYRISDLRKQGIPDELAKEILAGREDREQRQHREKADVEAARKRDESMAFINEYPHVDPKTIPAQVWKDVDAGIPLVHAYARQEAKELRGKLAEYDKKTKVAASSAETAASNPGSTTGAIPAGQDFFSEDRVASMSNEEVTKHWSKIMSSMKHW